ncbi:unnamed protein product [Ixodes pacificus]
MKFKWQWHIRSRKRNNTLLKKKRRHDVDSTHKVVRPTQKRGRHIAMLVFEPPPFFFLNTATIV